MQAQIDESKTKLMTAEEAATMLDLKRDYAYGRGVTPEREETHLRDYWRIIRRRLWVPLGVMLLATTLATIYNLRLPNIYEGVTKIKIERDDQVVNLKDIQINMGSADDSSYINTQLKIMQSPRVAYLVVKNIDLEHNSEFSSLARPLNSKTDALQVTEGGSDEQAEIERLEAFIDILLANVDVRPVRDTRLVEIHYQHRNKELARKISDAWANAFRQNLLDEKYRANKDAGIYLQRSIAQYRGKLTEAEERLQNYLRDKKDRKSTRLNSSHSSVSRMPSSA